MGDLEVKSDRRTAPTSATPVCLPKLLRWKSTAAGYQADSPGRCPGSAGLLWFLCPWWRNRETLDLRAQQVEVHNQLSGAGAPPTLRAGLCMGANGQPRTSRRRSPPFALAAPPMCSWSTTVVEVGRDVPEAKALMVDEHGRFASAWPSCTSCGGRVGGGAAVSHCLLINDSEKSFGPPAPGRLLVRSPTALRSPRWTCVCAVRSGAWAHASPACRQLALASLSDDGEVPRAARQGGQGDPGGRP